MTLDQLLQRQDGVVSRRQLVDLGVDPRRADRRLSSGSWTPLLPQVFLARTGPPTERQLATAALLHGGPGSALTGRVACRAWRLRDVPDGGEVDLLVPHGRRRVGGPGVRVVRTRRLPLAYELGDLVLVERERALLDAACDGMPLVDARALVLAAVTDGLAQVCALRRALDGGPRQASAHCRHALLDAERGAASAPEAEVADLVRPLAAARRLPLLLNPTLRLHGRVLGRPDLYLPTLALGVETDSRRHHEGVDDLDATLRRHAVFAAAGVRLLHTTPTRVRRTPALFLSELVVAVDQPWIVPAGLEVVPFRAA